MLTQSMPFPRVADRPAWASVAEKMRREVAVAAREALSGGGYPPLRARDYMAYARTGDREAMQGPYFNRRQRLIRAVLGTCVQGDDTYLGDTIDGLWCICEESSWCLSAHNDSGGPLVDVERPTIDLFAAQTASLVSWSAYLLEGMLPEQVMERVRREVHVRLLAPFWDRDDFWWMGVVRKDLNNWTPWILANTLQAARIWGQNMDEKATAILARWLSCIPEDGGVDEGAAYWNMAGASLLDCLELLGADRYAEPKIRNLAAFPLAMHIEGPYFLNFADCDARPMLDGERVYTFGKRTGNPALAALGSALAERADSIFPQDTPEFYRMLCRLFHPVESLPPFPPPEDVILRDLQVFIFRRGGLYAAIKGGHNGEGHNHNDVGALVVYVDGQPAIVDAGNMVYTARTFQAETRYGLWNTRSMNHTVPMLGGYEQRPGRDARAERVCVETDGVSMDIARAYPPQAGCTRLTRSLQAGKEGVLLRDAVSLRAPLPVTWVFLLRHAPALAPGCVEAGPVRIRHDASLAQAVEAYPVTDARMRRHFPGTLYRLAVTAAASYTHTMNFTIERTDR